MSYCYGYQNDARMTAQTLFFEFHPQRQVTPAGD
jgi:hypothetical protein